MTTFTKWDGLWRCEIHPAGTHSTIAEASACLEATGTAEELRQATFDFPDLPLLQADQPSGEEPKDGPRLFDGLREQKHDWSEVAHDYTSLLTGDFDVKYPGWSSNPDFMDNLREHFEGVERGELPRCCCRHLHRDHDESGCRWLHCDCFGPHTFFEGHPDSYPIAATEDETP